MYGIIPVVTTVWVSIKAIHEIRYSLKYDRAGIFIDGDPAHTNQHMAILIGILGYSISVPLLIILGGLEFSLEWIPVNTYLDICLVYAVEHFSIEREGEQRGIKFRDLFKLRKMKPIKDYKHEHLD